MKRGADAPVFIGATSEMSLKSQHVFEAEMRGSARKMNMKAQHPTRAET